MAKNGKLFPTDVTPNKTEKHPIRFQRMGLRLRPRWGDYSAPQTPLGDIAS